MKKTLLLFLITISFQLQAQEQVESASIDSISYAQYMEGDWDGLIATGKLAAEAGIDFKWLQQRLGYAYFIKKQYYRSMQHYENALKYDQGDMLTHLYLYYNGIYTGDAAYARYHASRLSPEYLESTGQKAFRILDAIDVEYSYKIAKYESRENAHYRRFGLSSWLGWGLNLYQTLTDYKQTTDYTTLNSQNEYFGLLNWNIKGNSNLSAAYHYVGTRVVQDPDTFFTPGHMFFLKAHHKFNRFDLSLTGAQFSNEWINSFQTGLHAGVGFAGTHNAYFKSSLYRIWETGLDYDYSRFVFRQTAGISPWKYLWTEASVTLGNLYHFIDDNGLYIYNSLDATTFRAGMSVFGFVSKNLTLYANYSYDEKYTYLWGNPYTQHSITGGIIWKI